jgi:hypothetical protein
MNGWQELADAIRADFEAPSLGEQLAEFMRNSIDDPTAEEMFEAVDVFATGLSPDKQREMASRLLCRASGIDPDEKCARELGVERPTLSEQSTRGAERTPSVWADPKPPYEPDDDSQG